MEGKTKELKTKLLLNKYEKELLIDVLKDMITDTKLRIKRVNSIGVVGEFSMRYTEEINRQRMVFEKLLTELNSPLPIDKNF